MLTTRKKVIVISKITDFTFCWEKEQIIDKKYYLLLIILGISFTKFWAYFNSFCAVVHIT